MKIDPKTAAALGVTLAVIFGLSAYGQHLGLDADTLDGIRTGAASLGALVLAALGALLRRDDNKNGVPDVLEGK